MIKKTKEKKKIKLEELTKEKNDLESIMSHLESEYRKANISEKSYSELKEKYSKRLRELNTKLGIEKTDKSEPEEKSKSKETKKPEKKEVEEKSKKTGFLNKLFSDEKEHKSKEVKTEEGEKEPEKVEEETKKESEEKTTEKPGEEKSKKPGFFNKLFGGKKEKKPKEEKKPEKVEKKEEKSKVKEEIEVGEVQEMTPEVIEKLAQQVAGSSGTTATKTEELVKEETSEEQAGTPKDIEIEKLRVMIDAMREEKRATDETIRSLSESIGEIRSMVFQADGSLRETMLKMEKIEDEISEVKPTEIDKKLRGINERMEKNDLTLEKVDKKSEDLAEKINKVHEMLKGIGSTENLMTLNKDIQEKLEDINEAVKYIERLGTKTEKIFVDLNQYLGDFIRYKARQEDVEESLKEIVKSIDALNVKFEDYVNKKDLDSLKEDDIVIKKQIEEINKVLPILKAKLPDEIAELRREKEDISLLLDAMKEQLNAGKISKVEYERAKKNNEKKLKEIERDLDKEWRKIENLFRLTEDLVKLTETEKTLFPETKKEPEEEKKETTEEQKPEKVEEETKKSEEIKEKPGEEKSKKPGFFNKY
jgi:hypothetical protein